MIFKKGDRVRISIGVGAPACSGSFGPGWGEGILLSAVNNEWDPEKPPNWYIELEKDKVSGRGWRTGYGYWKQQQDGGTIRKVEEMDNEEIEQCPHCGHIEGGHSVFCQDAPIKDEEA